MDGVHFHWHNKGIPVPEDPTTGETFQVIGSNSDQQRFVIAVEGLFRNIFNTKRCTRPKNPVMRYRQSPSDFTVYSL